MAVYAKLKELIIASGFDVWLRPLWWRLSGQKLDDYDLHLKHIIDRLPSDACCIDVGCHEGVILDIMRKRATSGTFYGFEPIPRLAKVLRKKYARDSRVKIFEVALYDRAGEASFFIRAELALSGLKSRSDPSSQEISVQLGRLDDVLPNVTPQLIKIDVEGAELGVLRGASETIKRAQPIIAFEFGLGGADYYATEPTALFDFFQAHDLQVWLLPDFVALDAPLSRDMFLRQYREHLNYYFVAAPGTSCG